MENNKFKDETHLDPEQIDINTDSDIPGDNYLSDPLEVNEQDNENTKLREEVAEQKDKFLRLAAEFDNYKRRTSKERIELMQVAGKDIMVELLDVLDDTDRAEKQMENSEDLEHVIIGNKLVFAKLKNLLTQRGLKPTVSVGEDFDVEKHEAITEVPVDEKLKGKVIDEVQKGYTLNDKIIRFAKVVVGK